MVATSGWHYNSGTEFFFYISVCNSYGMSLVLLVQYAVPAINTNSKQGEEGRDEKGQRVLVYLLQKYPEDTSTGIILTRTASYAHTYLQGRLGYLLWTAMDPTKNEEFY